MFPGATDEREATDTADRSDRDGETDARGRESDRGGANFAVVGAPLDATTTFQPGTRFGPQRIRSFATPFDDYDHRTDQRFSDLGVVDRGDVRAWNDVEAYLEYLTSSLREAVWNDAVPLTLGGEHRLARRRCPRGGT